MSEPSALLLLSRVGLPTFSILKVENVLAFAILYCSEAVLHSIANVYFIRRPLFTMLYPTSNYFLSQFPKRDSWVPHFPLNRQRALSLILKGKAPTTPNLKKNKVLEAC